ncbi:hypothetical protein [Mycobacterium sp. 050134]|uniref:hypothetical protein n=1 Tax=Mycobacterium sp. 050134 TaxID=3096111 RepID=UPI002ED8E6F1
MRMKLLAASAATFALAFAPAAQAAQTPYQPVVPVRPGTPATVQPLDCQGSTGDHGCGAGFYWRNGDHGWACYPCN